MTETTAPPPRQFRYARELSALIVAPFLVWVIGWSHEWAFNATMALVSALALYEFLSLGRRKNYDIPVPLCIAVMLFIIAAFVLEPVSVEMGVFATLLIIPGSYVFRKGSLDDALPASAIAVLGTAYVGMLGGSLIRLRHDFIEGPRLVFFLLLVVWLGDAGAYYVGKRFGKRKLSPRISPKKTVEGGLGGIVTSMIAAVIIQKTFLPEVPLLHAMMLALVLSISGVIGDLVESMWKRSAAVKDSGGMIPGHGGFLDRFDSIFFTAPIVYVYWAFVKHGATTLNMITG